MNKLKQSIIAIYNANKRLINSGACLGVVLVNIALATHYAEIERELRLVTEERNFFMELYEESKEMNQTLSEISHAIQADYHELISGNVCVEMEEYE